MALIDRLHDLNRHLPGRAYYRLFVNQRALGFVDTQLLGDLADSPLFSVDKARQRVMLNFDNRAVFEAELETFFKAYFAKYQLGGWRDERYAISEYFAGETYFLIERAAVSYLGLTGYGVHINGYVENADGSLSMWIAKRALTKQTFAGKLDQIAAGGQPTGIGLMENVIKECQEEASIPRQLAEQAKPVSAISYWYDLSVGVRPDIMFNYDLQLPPDFVPQINDDEVDSFACYRIDEVLEQLAHTRDFKFNSAAVIIDFAIRHGVITPEHPDYVSLQEGMNQRRSSRHYPNVR